MKVGDHLRRRFILDVEKSGHVFVRDRESNAASQGLPVFSTDTREEAEGLIVRCCVLESNGSGLYRLNDWPLPEGATLDDLERAAETFQAKRDEELVAEMDGAS
ncbi:MAG: hypothetical protein SangKO_010940 [Sandaracinaceae bacterium]